jgi:hypothetical protein
LVYNSGGVGFILDSLAQISDVKNQLARQIYKICLYNLSFELRIDPSFDLRLVRAMNNASLTCDAAKGVYLIHASNLYWGQKCIYLFYLQPTNDQYLSPKISGSGNAYFCRANRPGSALETAKEFLFDCRISNKKDSTPRADPNVIFSVFRINYILVIASCLIAHSKYWEDTDKIFGILPKERFQKFADFFEPYVNREKVRSDTGIQSYNRQAKKYHKIQTATSGEE